MRAESLAASGAIPASLSAPLAALKKGAPSSRIVNRQHAHLGAAGEMKRKRGLREGEGVTS